VCFVLWVVIGAWDPWGRHARMLRAMVVLGVFFIGVSGDFRAKFWFEVSGGSVFVVWLGGIGKKNPWATPHQGAKGQESRENR